jgi:hypothetical protein
MAKSSGDSTDVEHDQLDQAARVHQRSQRCGVAPGEAGQPGGRRAAAELAQRGDQDDAGAQQPGAGAAQQPDLGAQAGEGEEGGQQQHHHHPFDVRPQLPRDARVVRHDDPQNEGAEDGVDPDRLGDQGRQQQGDESDCHHAMGDAAMIEGADPPRHQRTHNDQQQADIRRGQHHRDQYRSRLRFHHADHEGEQAPGGNVVDRGASQRYDPEPRPLNAAVGEDAGEHREGGDRHRHAEEQGECGERHVARREPRIERQRQQRAEHERQSDAGVGDGGGATSVSPRARVHRKARTAPASIST